MEQAITRDCERQVERFADLADSARAQGQRNEADHYLLLAWAAFDDPDGLLGLDDEPLDDPNHLVLPLRRG